MATIDPSAPPIGKSPLQKMIEEFGRGGGGFGVRPQPEVDEVELFHWLMDNWSESKQNIVARLKRDFTVTKKGK